MKGTVMQKKHENTKRSASSQEINKREYGTEYGTDTSLSADNGKGGGFAGDPSEMRKAPGYYGSVPGVNTPEMRFPGAEDKQDVSIPAFNPPVPNRAWTEMRKHLSIETMSEAEKRELYGNRKEHF